MGDKLRVIFYQDQGTWLAQGLEHDICVQADTLEDLYGRFEVAVRLECGESGSLDHVPEAPAYFQRMWERKSGEFHPAYASTDRYEVGMAA